MFDCFKNFSFYLLFTKLLLLQSTAEFVARKKRRMGEKEHVLLMPGACKVVGYQLIFPQADVKFMFPAATAVERNESAFIFHAAQEEHQSTPVFEIALEEENQVPIPSEFDMQAKKEETADDFTTEEQDLAQVDDTTVLPIPSVFKMQAEDETDDSNSAKDLGSGFGIDNRGRLRRISNRTRSRESAEDLPVEETTADKQVAQTYGSGSAIDNRGRLRRISNRTRSR